MTFIATLSVIAANNKISKALDTNAFNVQIMIYAQDVFNYKYSNINRDQAISIKLAIQWSLFLILFHIIRHRILNILFKKCARIQNTNKTRLSTKIYNVMYVSKIQLKV